MSQIASSSSSPADERLIRVPLELIHPHPANANRMSEDRLEKLARNIEREGRYPPLAARPHPDLPCEWQLLDGEHRLKALRRLGIADALIFPWPCDDETALILLTTLNRLEGEDVPAQRAALLQELTTMLSVDELAQLLPEDASAITSTLALLDLDSAALLADLEAAATRTAAASPRLLSFAVSVEDEQIIETALAIAQDGLTGHNVRGRALALLARSYLDGRDHG